VQTAVDMAPFQLEKNGVTYTLTPLYSYDIYGMGRYIPQERRLHRYGARARKDWINIEDVLRPVGAECPWEITIKSRVLEV